MGIGIGAKNATVPIYSAEMAPHRIRGALVMFWQLWVVMGEFCHSENVPPVGQVYTDVLTHSRYLPGLCRKHHRQGCWQNCMATTVRLSIHSFFSASRRHLLLPRISSLANEA